MFEAKIKGTEKLVSYFELIHKFKGKYQNNEIELQCPACDQPVYLYGYKSIEVQGRLQHFPHTTCIFYEDVCKGVGGFSSYNFENGKRLRDLVETKEFASKLYCFCLELCGRDNLSVKSFCNLIKTADRKKLWMAAGLEEWVLGFLLLLLKDFVAPDPEGFKQRTDKNRYQFRFVLVEEGREEKTRKIKPEDIWEKGGFILKKVFESGQLMKLIEGNPFDVSLDKYEKYTSRWETTQKNFGEELIKTIKLLKCKGGKND